MDRFSFEASDAPVIKTSVKDTMANKAELNGYAEKPFYKSASLIKTGVAADEQCVLDIGGCRPNGN